MSTIRMTAGPMAALILATLSALSLAGCGEDPMKDTELSNDGESGFFSASSVRGPAPLTVAFSLGSDQVFQSATLDFGDGESSDLPAFSSGLTHTFTEPGTFAVTLNGTRASGETVTDSILVTATQVSKVNLVVTSFAIDTEIDVLDPLNTETVSAIIQNVGSEALSDIGSIDVGYYLSTDEEITVDDIFIGDTSIVVGDSFRRGDVEFGFETLGPGENYQFNVELSVKRNIPSGTYHAGVIVDYRDYHDWYTFARTTDTAEYAFPEFETVEESDEGDNARMCAFRRS